MTIPSHPHPTSNNQLTSSMIQQVARIKERVEEKEGIPPVQQRLIFGGKQMYLPPTPPQSQIKF